MADRKATAIWEGTVREGQGMMKFGSFEGPFSYTSRFEDGQGTNPEELIGAAHAGCFSMALSSGLTKAGFAPIKIETTAHISLRIIEGKTRITRSHLITRGQVEGISKEEFQAAAEAAKANCPVSTALAGVEITLDAQLV